LPEGNTGEVAAGIARHLPEPLGFAQKITSRNSFFFFIVPTQNARLYTSPIKLKHWSSKLALNVIEERSKASFGLLPAGAGDPMCITMRAERGNPLQKLFLTKSLAKRAEPLQRETRARSTSMPWDTGCVDWAVL
jgi:hypothetical protein